jgi:hypothetical protein
MHFQSERVHFQSTDFALNPTGTMYAGLAIGATVVAQIMTNKRQKSLVCSACWA